MSKKERKTKGKKKWAMIRVTEDARKRLAGYKILTDDTYSTVILKNVEPPKDIWINLLDEGFKTLEADFPDKEGLLEYMKVIIFKSKSLSKELAQKYDKEAKSRLSELQDVNKILQPKSGIEPQKDLEKNPTTPPQEVLRCYQANCRELQDNQEEAKAE